MIPGSTAPDRRPALPIDALLPAIVSAVQRHGNLVLEAAPGAGKTTRVPPALLALVTGEVLVLEPRRIAARLAARRVAAEMGEAVGETVGYQVRFEEVAGPRTRLRFVTEGILTRRLLLDPQLRGVDAVVLDEFHERHLESDFALALLRRLQQTRPELKIVVMSATLDAAPVARYLGECPVLRSEGRAFPLTVDFLPYTVEPLEFQVRSAVQRLLRAETSGHILVFLPGLAEIRRTARTCASIAHAADLRVLPLYGDLAPAEQDAVVAPGTQRKLILATNVAESSVTVEGVTAVIDSGLARFATDSPWTGLTTLQVGRISKASARQRAGRAGRTGPGQVLRLYPEEDFAQRPEHDLPEIERSDLSQIALALRAMGISSVQALPWLDPPPEAAVRQAERLLDRLGATSNRAATPSSGTMEAVEAKGAVEVMGAGETMAQRLARFPLPPRLARVLVEALDRGVGEDGCRVAALLGSGARVAHHDLLVAMDAPLDPRTRQHLEQLRRVARLQTRGKQDGHDEEALLQAVLTGFPDRVARRRAGQKILLSSGISAAWADETENHDNASAYEFMVVVDAEDRAEKPLPLVRMTARVEPEWLLDLFPEHMRDESRVVWNRSAERVEAVSALSYDELVLEASRDARPETAAAAALLAERAIEAGIERFVDAQALDALLARLAFAGQPAPDVAGALRQLCAGLVSFTELKRVGDSLLPLLEQQADAQQLRKEAPASLTLKNGRQVKIHYERGKPPWIASRLQDFFGMHETPRLGRDRTPVVVHLLAPNQRAVQTTTDLPGFWERLYPQVRRELMRRYPRHAWPERP